MLVMYHSGLFLLKYFEVRKKKEITIGELITVFTLALVFGQGAVLWGLNFLFLAILITVIVVMDIIANPIRKVLEIKVRNRENF